MSNEPKALDSILNHRLRPWLPHNSLDSMFDEKPHSLKEYTSEQPLRYQIAFYRPFDNKTEYYSRLILNSIKSDFDKLYQLINEGKNENLIRHWLNDTLNTYLKTQLKDIGKIITEKDYSLDYINPKKTSFEIGQDHKPTTHIVQLLKLAYMQVYLEIQGVFEDKIDDLLIVDDFYTQLFFEPVPDIYYLKDSSN